MACRGNTDSRRSIKESLIWQSVKMECEVLLMRVVRRILPLVLVLTGGLAPLGGATLERLTLDDLIAKSTAIVRGKVTARYASFRGPIIYTHYEVQVSQRAAEGNERLFTGRSGSGRKRQQSAPVLFRRATTRFGRRVCVVSVDGAVRPEPDHGLDPRVVPTFPGSLIEYGDTRGEYRTYAGGRNQPSGKG